LQQSVVLTLLGGAVAGVGLLFLGCGPTPGGTCATPSEDVVLGYLFGSAGAALITVAQMKGRRGSTSVSSRSSHQGVVGATTTLLGGTVMMMGLLFSCANPFFIAGTASCGVGPLAALIAYGFGIGGATLLAMGLFEMRMSWTHTGKHSERKEPST